MKYKAIIFDLDNTIYPVLSISHHLFDSLFQLLDKSGEARNHLDDIKAEVQRKPFQGVAAKYGLSENLTKQAIQLLKSLSVEGDIKPFDDYTKTRNLPVEKFLVTTGFTKLQQSKIQKMEIEKDFREIHIVDPENTSKTKKDVFAEIMKRNSFCPEEVLVVGDDPESEIKAAMDLGIKAVLYDKIKHYPENASDLTKIADFGELHLLLSD